MVEQSNAKTKRRKRTILKIFRKINREQHLIQRENARAEVKSLSKKNKNEEWKNFASSLNSNTPINQAWNRKKTVERQRSKKINIIKVNEAQCKDTKRIANKIDDTLAELYFPQNYDSTFLELKQKKKHKNYTCGSHQQRKL